MKSFKPMLAYGLFEDDLPNLKYPLILQQKIDGIRCCIVDGKALSRKLKPIPNRFIREKLEQYQTYPVLIDGELIIEGKTFNEVQSAVMSEEGTPNFIYKIFDYLLKWDSTSYLKRSETLHMAFPLNYARILNSIEINSLQQLLEWESYILKDRYEGIILRSPGAPYKFGRSTLREAGLMKFKRFTDSEAIILSSAAFLSNCNPLESDNLGYAKHSSAQINLIPENKLGSFTVRDCNPESPFYNVEFNLGTGFTDEERKELWKTNQIGKIIKYKYQLHGSKDKPRIPVFLGFRED